MAGVGEIDILEEGDPVMRALVGNASKPKYSGMAVLLLASSMNAAAQQPRGVLVDNFGEQAQYTAKSLGLDIGEDKDFTAGWAIRGTAAQQQNKQTIGAIVLYCARVAHNTIGDLPQSILNYPSQAAAARQSYDAATLTAWRLCEDQEADAYKRLMLRRVTVDKSIIRACTTIPDSDSYAAIDRCIEVETKMRDGR